MAPPAAKAAAAQDAAPEAEAAAPGDMPAPPPPLESEAFPGEGQLTEDERSRWLVLHFALPRTIMTCDLAAHRSTESELNDVLSQMAWGTVDPGSSEWVLESEEPTLDAPHSSLISYKEFCERAYPADDEMEEEARQENLLMAAEKRAAFTSAGEPGFKFRPMLEQMVKCLEFQSKALKKAYDIKKPILNEDDVPADPSRTEAHNILRYGRTYVDAVFCSSNLTKSNRRFSVVLRASSEEQLAPVQQELAAFCQMQHPCYDGKNKTQKPPPMNGEKGSRDMRLHDAAVGSIQSGKLVFDRRPGRVAEDGTETEPEPAVYSFPPFHDCYAGLMNQILGPGGANTAAIVEPNAEAGKLLLVDHEGGFAETQVQHVFFDGRIGAADSGSVDVRDVVSGEPVPFAQAKDVFLHRVDLFQAATDPEYFVRAVEACELNMSSGIVGSRKVEGGEEHLAPEAAKALPPVEWLHHNIILRCSFSGALLGPPSGSAWTSPRLMFDPSSF
ncbi:unnamed protein product [Prorocentrum cordatum]|uniref:Uncharacterized protein n=1 Tax=Prorocentrum cordatum TaxID=2364126 RepID=A0ABN9TVA9_9DINO|nr:unnamed protein product [Polarella glacialis]